MNPQNQGTGCSPADPPQKRKRGRPRKDESLAQGENVPATPAADSMKKNKQSACTIGSVGDEMVGQVVSGVIEGSFDAGYLLKVKVGDTDTHLRGVVFLPGRFSPITASNDVAPQAKMYRRTEMPLPVANPQTLVPGPVPSSEQSDKQPVELQNLAPIVQVQGLPSELQSTVSIPQENQPTSNILPLTDNLPMSSTGSSLGGRAASQILESGLGSQSTSIMPQMGHDKFAEQIEVLKEFEGSITKVPNAMVEATEQSKSVPKSAPSVDCIPTSGTVNLELQIQHQAMSDEFKPNQSLHDGVKSPNLEHNQVSVITEPEIMSAEPIGIKIWMEKLASPNKAAVPELAMNVISGNDASHLNRRPVSHTANVTEADSESALIGGLPVTLFEREAVPSAPKLANEGSPQRMVETQLCNPSGATNVLKADSDSATVTSLPVTLFEREAIPSEPKLAIDGPVLPRITEPLFCSSSGAANNVDCNLKDAIPPAES
ncbi:hypothetical protein P3X46_033423 [Hevea brasiliensis]|uniref:AT hook motif-containing protein n=1 Tax=Hevea brasiliensis TaxID=3981 RepID=A0ABQ9KGB5_HEVBR|nr:uncharacterized protein LOC110638392 [Hevea brasiliensis]XP_057996899.1 uncharacterized protein LOC110638392 [Hevea brasiliensis]KAJ9136332.1 hypothetical protein P3X46_033423 [Hevea brasiliensis]